MLEQLELGRRIYGFGAAAKGNTLLNFCGLKSDFISGVFDNAGSKIGRYMPGSRIEILDMNTSYKYDVDVALIFPWNIKSEIFNHIKKSHPNCRIYTLIPGIEEIS